MLFELDTNSLKFNSELSSKILDVTSIFPYESSKSKSGKLLIKLFKSSNPDLGILSKIYSASFTVKFAKIELNKYASSKSKVLIF